ncbi:MAG: ring-hydroxylating oxygenase subunit alpha [Gammaproteobacteria bacterium]|nr:ring-hydroxylating oxygenase subunit alpha [Gammaproteobacteria bacterium]
MSSSQNILDSQTLSRIGKGYHAEAAKSWSLHADCYQDPVFLEAERRHVFHNSWQFLCHEEKLREPGSYVVADVQGQSIAACRGADGKLRAFFNVCKHRGHELLRGEGKTKVIVCPYHAWSYGLDGALLQARCSQFVENFDRSRVRLTGVQVETFCHLVFVNLNPEAGPLTHQSGSLEGEIFQYAPDIGGLTFAHRLIYDIQANWKTVVDNFLECCHCPVAHRDFCTLVEMDTYKVKTHGIYSSHMAKAGRSANNAYGVDDAQVTDHAVWYLWPNTTLMRYPGRGNFMVWRFYPAGPESTREVFDFFFETAAPNAAEMEAIKFIDEVLQPEDIGLVESVQRGMQTPGFNQGRYLIDPQGSGMSEHAVHHFHGLVLDAYRRAART